MSKKQPARELRRKRRQKKIKGKKTNDSDRLRLVVTRSNRAVYAQVVDGAKTLAHASTFSKELKGTKNTVEGAKIVGTYLGKLALKNSVKKVFFDRRGYLYHGKIKALADGAKESGLEF